MKWKLQTQKNLVPHKPTMKSQLISNITHRKTKPTAPKYRGKTPRFFRDGYYTRVFCTEIMTSVKNQWVCVSVGAIVFSADFLHQIVKMVDWEVELLYQRPARSHFSHPFLSGNPIRKLSLTWEFGRISYLSKSQLVAVAATLTKHKPTCHLFTAQPRQSIIFVWERDLKIRFKSIPQDIMLLLQSLNCSLASAQQIIGCNDLA